MDNPIDSILRLAAQKEAQEVVCCAEKPVVMVDAAGKHHATFDITLAANDILTFLFNTLSEGQLETFKTTHFIRMPYRVVDETAQYLLISFVTAGEVVLQLRRQSAAIRPIAEYPEVVRNVLDTNAQKVIICFGDITFKDITNSIVNYYNETNEYKIILIEKSRQHVHRSKKSLVFSLEVGSDVESTRTGLQRAYFSVPDVLCIEEAYDYEDIDSGFRASYSAHITILNINASDVISALSKIIHTYPPYQYRMIKNMLGEQICAMFGQKSVETKTGERIPIYEILIKNDAVKAMLVDLENRLEELKKVMASGSCGMMTFDQQLERMHEDHLISKQELLRKCSNRDYFLGRYGE